MDDKKRIIIVDFDDTGVGRSLSPALSDIFDMDCKPLELPFPKTKSRGTQCDARDVVKYLGEQLARRGNFIFGIMKKDSFVPDLNFVFGLADVKSGAAMISLSRLGSSKPDIFLERCLKEAVHEIGHLHELSHCDNRLCVMHFSNSLLETDLKSHKFCEKCTERLRKGRFG